MSDKTDKDYREELSPEQYHILREKGTEPAFSGKFDKFFQAGIYNCGACGEELFASDGKYDSGCGWPAFFKAIAPDKIKTEVDLKYGMVRTEIMCANCGSHLGHVFDDGPQEHGGQRFCVNSKSLGFKGDGADEIIEG